MFASWYEWNRSALVHAVVAPIDSSMRPEREPQRIVYCRR